jgi:hypothetical protein
MLRRHHEHFTVREFAVKLKRLSWATPLVVILALSSVAVTHGGNVDAIAERRGTVIRSEEPQWKPATESAPNPATPRLSQNQPTTIQNPNQTADQAPPAQANSQPPQSATSISDLLHSQQFIREQTKAYQEFLTYQTKEYQNFIRDQTKSLEAQSANELAALKSDTEREINTLDKAFDRVVKIGASFAVILVGIFGFFGFRTLKDIQNAAQRAAEEAAKNAFDQALESAQKTFTPMVTQAKDSIEGELALHRKSFDELSIRQSKAIEELQSLLATHQQEIHQTVSLQKSEVEKLQKLLLDHQKVVTEIENSLVTFVDQSKRNQQKWFKETSTGLSEAEFNNKVSSKKIMWADETHAEYNTWLIELLKTSDVPLTTANTAEEAIGALKNEKFNILIFDAPLFQTLWDEKLKQFHDSKIKKIINTGEDGYKKYKNSEGEYGVRVVDKDSDLLKELVN